MAKLLITTEELARLGILQSVNIGRLKKELQEHNKEIQLNTVDDFVSTLKNSGMGYTESNGVTCYNSVVINRIAKQLQREYNNK